uniref:Putative secreted peptide n=1 Tax=Anopheles braziliensis TaxID=58242 RepID=A0A2M3ZT15_9DIPT
MLVCFWACWPPPPAAAAAALLLPGPLPDARLDFQPQFFHFREDSFFFGSDRGLPVFSGSGLSCEEAVAITGKPDPAPTLVTASIPPDPFVVSASIMASLFIISCCVVCSAFTNSTSRSSGNFFVLKDAFVIIDFDTVTVVVAGVSATLIPIGPSLGCPDGFACSELRIAFVTSITSGSIS